MKGWKIQMPLRKCPNCGCALKGVFSGTYKLYSMGETKRGVISPVAEGNDETKKEEQT